jgi:hypothetical protein
MTYIVFLSSQLELLSGILSNSLICVAGKSKMGLDREDKGIMTLEGATLGIHVAQRSLNNTYQAIRY